MVCGIALFVHLCLRGLTRLLYLSCGNQDLSLNLGRNNNTVLGNSNIYLIYNIYVVTFIIFV